jgi:hypothetical protein
MWLLWGCPGVAEIIYLCRYMDIYTNIKIHPHLAIQILYYLYLHTCIYIHIYIYYTYIYFTYIYYTYEYIYIIHIYILYIYHTYIYIIHMYIYLYIYIIHIYTCSCDIMNLAIRPSSGKTTGSLGSFQVCQWPKMSREKGKVFWVTGCAGSMWPERRLC